MTEFDPEKSDGIVSGPNYTFYFNQPKLSEWKCEMFGVSNMVLYPLEGAVPNWFWRKMQYLCFGNKWIKVKKES